MTSNDPNRNPLDALAARVSDDPFFLGSLLTVYQQRHDLDDVALAAAMGCSLDVLTDPRLCRRPGAALPERSVGEDVATIAGRFGVDAAALRRVVEEGAD